MGFPDRRADQVLADADGAEIAKTHGEHAQDCDGHSQLSKPCGLYRSTVADRVSLTHQLPRESACRRWTRYPSATWLVRARKSRMIAALVRSVQ
jgi:hypothetical protein